MAIDEKSFGPLHPNVAMVLNMGQACGKLGKKQEAINHLEQALQICSTKFGNEHSITKGVQSNLSSVRG